MHIPIIQYCNSFYCSKFQQTISKKIFCPAKFKQKYFFKADTYYEVSNDWCSYIYRVLLQDYSAYALIRVWNERLILKRVYEHENGTENCEDGTRVLETSPYNWADVFKKRNYNIRGLEGFLWLVNISKKMSTFKTTIRLNIQIVSVNLLELNDRLGLVTLQRAGTGTKTKKLVLQSESLNIFGAGTVI